MIPPPIAKKAIAEAVRTVSTAGAFWYSPRNLYYELVRLEAIDLPAGNPREELTAFRRALAAHEHAHGALEGLVRAKEARAAVPRSDLPDVFDYAVRRVLVFDRLETFLVFAKNGFHRKIEVALVVLPEFPAHVWHRLERQVASGFRTAFYTVHDANGRGANLMPRTKKLLRAHGKPRFADVGLNFAHAFKAGVPVRQRTKPLTEAQVSLEQHERLMLATGNYAHVEELRPLALMQWAYERIVRGSEDAGFG